MKLLKIRSNSFTFEEPSPFKSQLLRNHRFINPKLVGEGPDGLCGSGTQV